MLRCLLGECSGERATRYKPPNNRARNEVVRRNTNKNIAATKIQAAFRGGRERKKTLNKKLNKVRMRLTIGMTNNPGATGERTNRNNRANKRVKSKANSKVRNKAVRSPSSPIAHRTRSRTRARMHS